MLLSTLLIGLIAIAIAGYLTLGENPRAVAVLRWLYRWPLFIPFIVTGQIMRTFLAKNGMLESRADRLRIDRAVVRAEPARLAGHRRGVRLEAGAVRDAAARRRDGVARAAARRGRAQPRRAAPARARRHRASAGARDAARRPGLVVRDHALRAVGADDDQSEFADDDHRRRCVPDQHVVGLRGGQCAVPDDAGRRGRRCVVLSSTAARRRSTRELARDLRWPQMLGMAVVLALVAFAIFGPLANLFLWAFAEKWYFPNKVPQEFGFSFWARVFSPARRRPRIARDQRLDRGADRRV